MSAWKTANERGWTFGSNFVGGFGQGIGEFAASYAYDIEAGAILNGRVSASIRLTRDRGVGAGLVCRADESWNFLAFYTAPETASATETFARFGVFNEGILTNLAVASRPITLGTQYAHFSLEFYSDQLRGEVESNDERSDLSIRCVAAPFPGYAGLLRLYSTGLTARDVLVQPTNIPLSSGDLRPRRMVQDSGIDVFLCHASDDKNTIRQIAREFKDNDITYWVDEERIQYGDRVTEKIERALQQSRFVVPCISSSFAESGWSRAEYSAILNAELGGRTDRTVIPLVLDESDSAYVPLLLRDKRRAFYANKTEFAHFLTFLRNERIATSAG